MAFVDPDEVQIGAGRLLSPSERQQVAQWIGDAEMMVRRRLGDLSLLDQEALRYVVREAVVTRLKNPEGYLTESVDDYSYRLPEETRRIVIRDEWWALLDPDEGQASASIRPGFEPDSAHWPVSTPPSCWSPDEQWFR